MDLSNGPWMRVIWGKYSRTFEICSSKIKWEDYDKVIKSVIFVTGSLADGGAEKVMSILASGCAELGADITLVILRPKRIVYSVSDKVKIIQFTDKGKLATVKRIKKLHQVMKESAAEVVIPFLPIISLYTIIANIGVKKKLIMSERADPRAKFNNLPWKDKIGSFFMRKCGLYSLADWMVFQTPDAQSYYSEKVQKKSSIIPNPLDIDNLPERYEGEREKRIVAAGRFSEEKNFTLLISGFAAFHDIFPEYTLTIYGEGVLRKDYEAQVQRLGLEKYVEFPGFVSNLPEEINKAAMYISTSNHEGISNSMLEALGMGVPTIVTDCPVGGSKMFVCTDENGVLISMENRDELISAMKLIATNGEYVKHISNNAVKIREWLAAPNICQQWLRLL